MFDINFISEPGKQKDTSDASWSFLSERNKPDRYLESDSKKSKVSFIQYNSWINYVFVLIIIGFIAMISILNMRHRQVQPNAAVLNQVIDLIIESDYIKTLQLTEAIFSMNQVKVTIRSENFTSIQSLSQSYRMEDEIPYEMYQKGEYSYLNLIFPWNGDTKGGDIQILKSMAENTVFDNKVSINITKDIFELQGRASDIISFLLQMAENKQMQKFNFSVGHYESGQFNLKIQLNRIL